MAGNVESVPPNGIGALPFTPTYTPNAIFLAIFAILMFVHVILAIRFWRFYGYSIGMVGGILLELLGYVAKVQLSHNRESKNAYIMYIIGLTLGPTFLSSALYLGISTLQRHYASARLRYISPSMFATIFIIGDFICLAFIGCGGSLAAIYAWSPIGVDLMIAGLATQVFFTAIFSTVLAIIYRRSRLEIVAQKRQMFILGSAVAAACLFIRSIWRSAELSAGFNGPLASMEDVFFVLDSVPMVVMSILLTCLHPEFWFREKRLRLDSLIGLSKL